MRLPILVILISAIASVAQDAPPVPDPSPKVKVNVLNVCTPSEAEQKELLAALNKVPGNPQFGPDFEVIRGQSSGQDIPASRYVRIRKELTSAAPYKIVQYSISADRANDVETLVFNSHEVKEIQQISVEDSVSAAFGPAAVMATDTPPTRIRLERFGKSSIILVRCETVDQTSMQPIFNKAFEVVKNYRRNLRLRTVLKSDVAWMQLQSQIPSSASKKAASEGGEVARPAKSKAGGNSK